MWEPRRLTILWASTAFYKDSFTFFYYNFDLKSLYFEYISRIEDNRLPKVLLSYNRKGTQVQICSKQNGSINSTKKGTGQTLGWSKRKRRSGNLNV
jgi:hypothetical protein